MVVSNRVMRIRKVGGISYGACFGSMVEVGLMNFSVRRECALE